MVSDYKCSTCGEISEYHKPYGQERFPDAIGCNKCHGIAKRIYKTSFVIPDDFKSTSR